MYEVSDAAYAMFRHGVLDLEHLLMTIGGGPPKRNSGQGPAVHVLGRVPEREESRIVGLEKVSNSP